MNTNEIHTGHPLNLTLPNDAMNQSSTEIWRKRALAAEKKLESFEYVLAYANDIVAMWPEITMRTLWKMTDKVATLKNALKGV